MATEVRIYTMKPGKLDDFVGVFKDHIMPTSAEFGIRVHAAWLHRAKNEFVWVRSYDSDEILEKYTNSPERALYTPLSQQCIESMDIRIVEGIVGDLPVANA